MNDDLQRKVHQFKTLMKFSLLINSTPDSREIRKYGVEAAVALSGAENGQSSAGRSMRYDEVMVQI